MVIAGGEMTEEALELKFNPITKFYEAPHQLRANNGVFIIDDFGRQKVSPRQLLNRWMYPLETRQDFCCLHTGQQFGIPFDQLIIFSTNLNPYSLADEAFLRRIRHKIFVGYVSPEQYLEIFRRVCADYNIAFDPEVDPGHDGPLLCHLRPPLCAPATPGTSSKTWWTGPGSWVRPPSSPPRSWTTSAPPISSNPWASPITTPSARSPSP